MADSNKSTKSEITVAKFVGNSSTPLIKGSFISLKFILRKGKGGTKLIQEDGRSD